MFIVYLLSVNGLYGEMFVSENRLGRLYPNGIFRLNRAGDFNVICILDMTYFPFDIQVGCNNIYIHRLPKHLFNDKTQLSWH